MSILLVNIGVKAMYAETIIHYVNEYHKCLVMFPFDTEQCPKQCLDYQYPAFSIVVLVQGTLVTMMLIPVFLFLQRAARTGLQEISVGLLRHVCCKATS